MTHATRQRARSGASRHFVLAAGGTGGHLIPAFALASELEARGHHVALVTDERGSNIPGRPEGLTAHVLPAGRFGRNPVKWIGGIRADTAESTVSSSRNMTAVRFRNHAPHPHETHPDGSGGGVAGRCLVFRSMEQIDQAYSVSDTRTLHWLSSCLHH